MSLINQMLSDLDQRQASAPNSNDSSQPYIPIPVPSLDNSSKITFLKAVFYSLTLILLSITSYYSYAFYNQQNKSDIQIKIQQQKTNLPKPDKAPKATNNNIINVPAQSKHAQVKISNKAVKPTHNSLAHTAPTIKPKLKLKQVNATAHIPHQVATNHIVRENEQDNNILANDEVNIDLSSVIKQKLKLNPAQQAEVAYKNGYKLLQQNKIYSAESKLLLALEHNTKHIKAREMLIGLYLKTGRKVEAEDILVKGILHLPKYSNFPKLYARLLLDMNQISKAVKLLLRHKPDISSDPNYYALLAASYQRKKDHNAAANTYVKLLKLKPKEGIWWVGMAISLEALNKNKEALNAYEKARQTGTLNTRISTYSSQRLKQLNINTNINSQ